MSFSCSLVVTYWARADLLAPLYVTFSCVYITFPNCVLSHVWNLIVSIPDRCLLLYLAQGPYAVPPVRSNPQPLYLDSNTLPLDTALAYCMVITMKVSDYCCDLGEKGLGQIYLTNYDVNSFFIFVRGCPYIAK